MAEKNLDKLLGGMSPKPIGGKYYIGSMDESMLMQLAGCLDYLVALFRESEGLTIVVSEEIREEAQGLCGKELQGPFALITLGVNSDLLAVGFLARIATALAEKGISINAYSAYYHDHLLVPFEKKDLAMAELIRLSESG